MLRAGWWGVGGFSEHRRASGQPTGAVHRECISAQAQFAGAVHELLGAAVAATRANSERDDISRTYVTLTRYAGVAPNRYDAVVLPDIMSLIGTKGRQSH